MVKVFNMNGEEVFFGSSALSSINPAYHVTPFAGLSLLHNPLKE
jgi:hypothetical protein